MIIEGRVWLLSDAVSTDAIIGADYIRNNEPRSWVDHVLEIERPDFAARVGPGDVIVAGSDFGAGSIREHAAIVLYEAGVRAVIARSFARNFYRNGFNNGLILFEMDGIQDKIEDGGRVRLDPAAGVVSTEDGSDSWQAAPVPPFLLDIAAAGGLIPWLRGGGQWARTSPNSRPGDPIVGRRE